VTIVSDQPFLPPCLACGYDRSACAAATPCPECGTVPDPDAAARCARRRRSPLRRALGHLAARPAPPGWWFLLDPGLRTRSTAGMVASIVVSTALLAGWFWFGSFVTVIHARTPIPARVAGTEEAFREETATLAALSRVHRPWASPLEQPASFAARPAGATGRLPEIETLEPGGNPILAARVSFLAVVPALGLFALRYAMVPLALRIGRDGKLPPRVRDAAAVAADASVGSAALAFALGTVALGTVVFGLATLDRSGTVARHAAVVVAAWWALAPTGIVLRELASDRSRVAVPAAWRSALLAVVLFALTVAGALAAMGAVFRLVTAWLGAG